MISTNVGANSGTHNAPKPLKNADLELVVNAWPKLPEHIKAAIKALVQSHKENKQ